MMHPGALHYAFLLVLSTEVLSPLLRWGEALPRSNDACQGKAKISYPHVTFCQVSL